MVSALRDHLKNIFAWHNKRKIIVLSIDDYGNVRLDSRAAREALDNAGMKPLSRFDSVDSLETREDLEMLYEVLSSVKDKNGRNIVCTPFALPCNIDFERMEQEDFQQYHYELLPETFKKLAQKDAFAYSGAWELWNEGIANGLMVPQFHGREHFNVKVFEEKLANKDKELLTALMNRSYTNISSTGYHTIGATSAFEFWKFEENKGFVSIIQKGLDAFEKVYGYRATHFNAPGAGEHPFIHQILKDNGIRYIDSPWIKKTHQGEGKYKTSFNYTGTKNELGMINEVRNVVFEPGFYNGVDWVNAALTQISIAFRWNAPAIITSHRANYCGHIDPQNRLTGITALKELFNKIVQKWPDVEFMAANELGDLIAAGKH